MSKVSFIKEDLGFPPWAVAFDPLRPYLYIGGGGGAGQKEVPNKLTTYAYSRSKIEKIAELQIPDDSPSSLDVLATAPTESVLFAGVNSPTPKDAKSSGSKDHLRSYKVRLPKASKAEAKSVEQGSIEQTAKTCLFSKSFATTGDSYQRVCKLSKVKSRTSPSKRLCLLANSLAPESELIAFSATNVQPTLKDVLLRWSPIQNKEINDLDIFENAPGDFMVVCATAYEIYALHLELDAESMKPKTSIPEPVCIRSSEYPDAFEKKGRPKFRSIQFLGSSDLVCVLVNTSAGTELQVLRLLGSGSSSEVILRKRLPKSAGQSVNMVATELSADSKGDYQVVVAVCAQKNDVLVYTAEMQSTTKTVKGGFKLFSELNVAEAPMKACRLSPFWPPIDDKQTTSVEQYLRLASISLSNTLSLDTLPLTFYKGRWVLQKPGGSTIGGISINYIAIGFFLVIQLLLVQSYFAQKSGGSTSSPQLLPKSWSDAIAAYRERAEAMGSPLARNIDRVTHTHTGERLLKMLHSHHAESGHLPDPARKAIILSAPEEGTELSTEVHESPEDVIKQDVTAKKWEELSKTEQALWKQKLKKAGAWSAEYGETIFKGVFFSELAGAVGRAAAEAMHG